MIGHARVLDHRQTSDARADADANALVIAPIALESRVANRLHGRNLAVMHESVVAARVLARQILGDVEVLDLAGDARRKGARIEARNRRDAGAGREYVRPSGGKADSDRRYDAHPGYDYAASGHGVCDEGPARRSAESPSCR